LKTEDFLPQLECLLFAALVTWTNVYCFNRRRRSRKQRLSQVIIHHCS